MDDAQAESLADHILQANSIFVAGAGRSGLGIKAFAMRLMHIGYQVHVVGEITTPNIKEGDLLLIGSGSGETQSLVSMAKKAKSLGAKVALVTIFPQSTIGSCADCIVKIDAPTPKSALANESKSIQPMGSLFEQCLLLLLDIIILKLMDRSGKDSDTMFTRHANLE